MRGRLELASSRQYDCAQARPGAKCAGRAHGEMPLVSSLDDILGDLSRGVAALSTRATSALFASSASALLPAFQSWATRGSSSTEHKASLPILERAIEIGFELARTGTTQADIPALLQRLEWITPMTDAPAGPTTKESPEDAGPVSTAAQDCLICADVAIRVHVDPTFSAGPVIEYALEPLLLAETRRVEAEPEQGDGDEHPAAADALLGDTRVMAAVGFMWFAIMRLRSKPEPDPATIDEIRTRAAVLMP
jgi:hypothetical protein